MIPGPAIGGISPNPVGVGTGSSNGGGVGLGGRDTGDGWDAGCLTAWGTGTAGVQILEYIVFFHRSLPCSVHAYA